MRNVLHPLASRTNVMGEILKIAEAFRNAARTPPTKPYIEFPYPSNLDELAEKLVDLYLVASDQERTLVRERLTDTDTSDCLLCFVLRACSISCFCTLNDTALGRTLRLVHEG